MRQTEMAQGQAALAELLPALRQEVSRHTGAAAERIALDAPLTRHGLDSLAAAELQASLEQRWGVTVPLADLLSGADLLEIGRALLASAENGRGADPVEAGSAESIEAGSAPTAGAWPLSYGQKALWVLHHLAADGGAYHIAAAARLVPALDVAALRRALHALAQRHAALRTTFHDVDGLPMQSFDGGAPELREIDGSAWSESEWNGWLREESARPFDLAAGPLLRVMIVRRSPLEERLLLTAHHLVADLWSLALLTREISALYAAELQAAEPPPHVPAVSYADYVLWQQRLIAGRTGARLWDYWREQLSGPLPDLDLPTDRPRPPVQTYAGGSVWRDLGGALSLQVSQLAAASGATASSVLLAAFKALLHRYSGQLDLLVGMPTAGRRRPELAGLVGYLVNPVVVRTSFAGDPTFSALLARTHTAAMGAIEHADFPFVLLAERLRPDRDPSRSPLFQALFVWQGARRFDEPALAAFALRTSGAHVHLGPHRLESIAWPERASQFDLALRCGEPGSSCSASLQYNSGLLDAATAERMLGHFAVLLAAAAATPRLSLAELPLLAAGERDQILRAWSGASADALPECPAGACLHELVEAQAIRSPAAPALVEDERRWTYEELNRRANRLAHRLRRLGAGPEQRVGVLMRRSAEMVATLIGILKAGAAYVPLDPAYPAAWLAAAAADARLALVLTAAPFAGTLQGLRELDVADETIAAEPEQNPRPLAVSSNLAYVMYTSGSTGRPKGVAIEHRAPVERMRWARAAFPREVLAGVLASTSICFDLSVFELFAPLCWGGTVILAESALALPTLAAAREVTLLNTVPSAAAELASADLPPALHTVNLAGETLPPHLADRLYRHPGVRQVLNLYGPTEDATYSTCARVGRGAPRISIGRPLPGTRVYLLDAHLEPVPSGVPGELFLAGSGAARGYFGRPELTAERFIPDPWGGTPGGRLYRTGDLARWIGAGQIELLGRIDTQVKLRGFRIELEEIASVLREHPAVREAVVVVRRSPTGEPWLAAYAAPPDAGIAELRRHLRSRLPAHMIPAHFHLLPVLPRTLNGKIDRAALPASAAMDEAWTLPRTPTEEIVSTVWAEVLAIDRVSTSESFFHSGGHSLLAVRLAARLQRLFGVAVSLPWILEHPTVSRLAARIDSERAARRDLALPPLQRAPRRPPPPLSFAQERLWFLAQLEQGSPAYHMAAGVRLCGELRVAALAAALAEMVRRHEALRTTYARAGGPLIQVIGSPFVPRLPLIDLRALPVVRRESEARRLATMAARRPFDLGEGPLLRCLLLRTGAGEHLFALTIHHIASDGWSMGVLARELSVAYAALARGERPAALPALPVQYSDFALWQRSWLAGEELERQLGYWRRCLAGASPALDLPTDRPRPPAQTFRGARRSIRFAPELAAALGALGRRLGATLFMTLAGASAATLGRWASQQEIVVGTPIANRSRVEIEGLFGLVANTLAWRLRVAAENGFAPLVAEVRQTALGAYAHPDLPVEMLVDDLRLARVPGRSPLFQVLVGLWDAPFGDLDLPALSASRVDLDVGAAKLDLTLRFAVEESGLRLEAEYASALFDAPTIERLLARHQVLLAGAIANPTRPLADVPWLGPGELHQLLHEWNDTRRAVAPACIHELFELQAARSPDALAVAAGGERLTYRQLSDRSSRLAQGLRREGVGLEARVGLFLPRSVDQIVAILGVLKAGGAYVPLDTASPRQRLHSILEEAGVSLVVTAESLREKLPAGCSALLTAALESAAGAEAPDLAPLPAVGPANLAYLLYTSGSTGRPKGVMIEHHSVVNLALALAETVHRPAGAPLRVALNAPLVFDASVKQWIQLLAGHSLHIVPEEARPDARRLLELLREQEVEVLDCTPAQLSHLLAAGLLRQPGSLRRVLVGGEALRRADWNLLAAAERPDFHNVYGPTECTVDAAVADVGAAGCRPVLGRPIANVSVRVLDAGLHPVAPAVPGELCIGGAGVARGYCRRPDLTAERFVPDPWAATPGARMYRTGDLARQSPDGTLEFLNRLDHQVKLHGFRIELGEIEAVLGEHADVGSAAVLAPADEHGERRLAAYVERRGERIPSAADLRSHLDKKLPAYMVPHAFTVVAELPRTANGKIDRASLWALGSPAPERQAGAAPVSALEKVLAAMMEQVLGCGQVGLHDNFFELGGHSMRAAELVAGVRDGFGIDLPLFHVFDAPTVAGLAAVLLESPEWRPIVEELAPALLQLVEPPAGAAAGLSGGSER